MARFDENIYREPSMEEMMNGLEFEMMNNSEKWVKGFYPSILDNNSGLDEYKPDDEMRLAHAIVRVKKGDCTYYSSAMADQEESFYREKEDKKKPLNLFR